MSTRETARTCAHNAPAPRPSGRRSARAPLAAPDPGTETRRESVLDQALGRILPHIEPVRERMDEVNAHPFPSPATAADAAINFFEWNSLLAVPGDFLKTGTFHGLFLCPLARYLCRRGRGKRLVVLDDCEVGQAAAPPVRGLSRVDVLFGNSRTATLGDRALSLAWIGRHQSPLFDPANDFELAWRHLSPRGGLVFDLGPDAPAGLMARVEDVLAARQAEIAGFYRHKAFGLRFVIRK